MLFLDPRTTNRPTTPRGASSRQSNSAPLLTSPTARMDNQGIPIARNLSLSVCRAHSRDTDLTSERVALASSKSRQSQINMQRLMILSVLHHLQVDHRDIQRFFEAEKEYFGPSWNGLKTRLALLARQLRKDSWYNAVVDAIPRESAAYRHVSCLACGRAALP